MTNMSVCPKTITITKTLKLTLLGKTHPFRPNGCWMLWLKAFTCFGPDPFQMPLSVGLLCVCHIFLFTNELVESFGYDAQQTYLQCITFTSWGSRFTKQLWLKLLAGSLQVFPCMKEANNAAIWQAYFNCVGASGSEIHHGLRTSFIHFHAAPQRHFLFVDWYFFTLSVSLYGIILSSELMPSVPLLHLWVKPWIHYVPVLKGDAERGWPHQLTDDNR